MENTERQKLKSPSQNLTQGKPLQHVDSGSEEKAVIFLNPFNLTYFTFTAYNYRKIIALTKAYKMSTFFIVMVINDQQLYSRISKLTFPPAFSTMSSILEANTDFVFSPIGEMLLFNIGVINSITTSEIDKTQLKVVLFRNGVFLFSTGLQKKLLAIFRNKFKFEEERNQSVFFNQATNVGRVLNRKLDYINQVKASKFEELNRIKPKRRASEHKNNYFGELEASGNRFPECVIDKESTFDSDRLLFHILDLSNTKLEKTVTALLNEAESIRRMYLDVTERERSDLFHRIHSLETSIELIRNELHLKLNFMTSAQNKFSKFNRITKNFYFRDTFVFFIETFKAIDENLLMKIQQIRKIIRMVKENFLFLVRDREEKEDHELNEISNILAVLTMIYSPFSIISGLFGVNCTVPYQFGYEDSLYPFFFIIGTLFLIMIISVIVFKKINWV